MGRQNDCPSEHWHDAVRGRARRLSTATNRIGSACLACPSLGRDLLALSVRQVERREEGLEEAGLHLRRTREASKDCFDETRHAQEARPRAVKKAKGAFGNGRR